MCQVASNMVGWNVLSCIDWGMILQVPNHVDFLYPLAFFYTDGLPANQLGKLLYDGLCMLGHKGLVAIYTVCDGAEENTAWAEMCCYAAEEHSV